MHEQPTYNKKAERRVKDRLPIPTTCTHCGAAVVLTNNSDVYGRSFGAWPWIYLCQARPCRAYVGTHPETNLPLGTLATAAIRAARKAAKDQFNALWQGGQMSRTQAYSWLAGQLAIPVAACHFGWFDEAQCGRALHVLAVEKQPPVRTGQFHESVCRPARHPGCRPRSAIGELLQGLGPHAPCSGHVRPQEGLWGFER